MLESTMNCDRLAEEFADGFSGGVIGHIKRIDIDHFAPVAD